jgi:putative ATP-binding cassette transporter
LSGSFSLSWQEWKISIHGDLVWIVLGYGIVVNCIARKTGRPLVHFNCQQQRYEANFRFVLMRLREYAEAIALYGGEQRERHILQGYFKKVYDNFHQCIKQQKMLYKLLRSELKSTGIVSVGHWSSLVPYHEKVVTIKEKGGWALVA